MAENDIPKEEKIQLWEKHYSRAKEKEFYSIRRIDVLVISISGACIYIVFEILRFLNSADSLGLESESLFLKISAIASVIAIAMNFLSQITGYHANRYEAIYSMDVIKHFQEDNKDFTDIDHIDKKVSFFGKLTTASNIIATSFMFFGILFLVIYNLITFLVW